MDIYLLVTQKRSLIGQPKKNKKIMQSLGLSKIGKFKKFKYTDSTCGMIHKIQHLVHVKKI